MTSTCRSDKTSASQDQLGSARSASAQMGPEQGSEDDYDLDDIDVDCFKGVGFFFETPKLAGMICEQWGWK